MIKNRTPLSMTESLEYLKDKKNVELKSFINKFSKLTGKEAKELKEKLISLNLIKLNDKHLSKLMDLLPEDKEELNKVLVGVELDEDETNNVLQTIKEFK